MNLTRNERVLLTSLLMQHIIGLRDTHRHPHTSQKVRENCEKEIPETVALSEKIANMPVTG